MPNVTSFTEPKFVKTLKATEKFAAIEELAGVFEGTEICPDIYELVSALAERERIMSTGIGFSLAIPHAKIPSVKKMAFAIGISESGIPFESMDGELVHLVIMVVAGEKQHKQYLRLVAKIMAIVRDPDLRKTMIAATSPKDILDLLRSA